ncbi:MAG: TIGR04282 family arsenosugar biosynthesis glycosyltransferase [Chloroflexota bacterium]
MTINLSSENALLVMAKRPFPGKTKTRLTPFLSQKQASNLYECFLKDVLDKVANLSGVAPFVAYAPETAVSYFQAVAPHFGLLPQRGEALGDRLDDVLTACQNLGYKRVAAMNSDSPNLPPDYLSQAFERLADEAVDLVLGPCEDGGYYLIGWKRPYPAVVREVTMSTPRVLPDTLAIANKLGLTVALLPEWYDVDSKEELNRLSNDLKNAPDDAPRTAAFLKELFKPVT